MTRRDAAVLVLVGAGLWFLLVSLEYLSNMVGMFDPPVSFPEGWNPVIYFASYLVPFGLLLAAGQVLLRGRHGFARELFPDDATALRLEGQAERVRAFGSLAFTAIGLLAFSRAIDRLTAIIQVLQPYTWHLASPLRTVLVSVFHPLLFAAYIVLGWFLVSRRESLANRWLVPNAREEACDGQPSTLAETALFRVLGLCFMMHAIVPLSHLLLALIVGRLPGGPSYPWSDWQDGVTGALQLVFGIAVFVGRRGMTAAWRRVAGMHAS